MVPHTRLHPYSSSSSGFLCGFTIQRLPTTGPHHHLQSEVWTNHHSASSKGMSWQCETSSGSRPQRHRSYESVRKLNSCNRCHNGPAVQCRNDSAETNQSCCHRKSNGNINNKEGNRLPTTWNRCPACTACNDSVPTDPGMCHSDTECTRCIRRSRYSNCSLRCLTTHKKNRIINQYLITLKHPQQNINGDI